MSLTAAYQQVKDSVVRVLALNGQVPVAFGSGSVIDSGATVLTCAHWILPPDKCGAGPAGRFSDSAIAAKATGVGCPLEARLAPCSAGRRT